MAYATPLPRGRSTEGHRRLRTHRRRLAPRAGEHLKLKSVLAVCPELDALTGHVRAFGKMLTQLQGDRLPQWIKEVRTDGLPSPLTFVNGLQRDLAAVTARPHAALELWRRIESHVNRIKMIKRQMYGRAGFSLMRKRVLLA